MSRKQKVKQALAEVSEDPNSEAYKEKQAQIFAEYSGRWNEVPQHEKKYLKGAFLASLKRVNRIEE